MGLAYVWTSSDEDLDLFDKFENLIIFNDKRL